MATACVMDDSVAAGLAEAPPSGNWSVEHPSGEFSVALEVDAAGKVAGVALIRTARNLMRGEVLIPAAVWPKFSEKT